MTLVKHPVENFDPVTKFAEKEEKRRKEKRAKVVGTIIYLLLFILVLTIGKCNDL